MPARPFVTRLAIPFVTALLAIPSASTLSAQQSTLPASVQDALQNLSADDIRRRIRSLGLTQAELADRLRQAGFDSSLADRYFAQEGLTGIIESSPDDVEFLSALRTVGVNLVLPSDTLGLDLGALEVLPDADSTAASEDADSTGLPVFGLDVFQRRTSEFAANLTGPVGPDYQLGPGDRLALLLTGDVELGYTLDVTREGYLFIPDVGQVLVNGLSIADLEDRLYDRLGEVYSGISRAADASTRFHVSLGQLRTNQVYVVGQVESPGAYRVSSVATLLEALYAAGGPTETGSFRNVLLRRGDRDVGSFDLYRYLTAGETPVNLRVQEGDVVFVPAVGAQVALRGEVNREAYFELTEDEGLPELAGYAGGLRPDARQDLVQVDRILPPESRTDGIDRRVYDIDFRALEDGAATFPLRAGDDVTVLPILMDRRGWVEVQGAVFRPGTYELPDEPVLDAVVDKAGGAMPDVLSTLVHVSRLNQADGTRSLIRTTLAAGGTTGIQEFDRVTLFGRDSLLAPDSVGVFGFVANPGRYPLSQGMNATDLVLVAGGYVRGADPRQAEVVRTQTEGSASGTSTSFAVPLSTDIPVPDATAVSGPGPQVGPDVALVAGDEVYVRQLPQFRDTRRVAITGEVQTPGTYVLESMTERVTSVIERAGGLTPQSFTQGFRLIRDGITVGVDLERALAEPQGPEDPVLVDGDRLVIPILDPTVLVTGAVGFDTRLVLRSGMSLWDVIGEAGGMTPEADKGRISVQYANGKRATVHRFLGMTLSKPEIRQGATVFVPSRPEQDSRNWDQALARILAVASTVATVYIAVGR